MVNASSGRLAQEKSLFHRTTPQSPRCHSPPVTTTKSALKPRRLRFLWLEVSQDAFPQDGVGVGVSVRFECDVLLLDHLLLVGLLVWILGGFGLS